MAEPSLESTAEQAYGPFAQALLAHYQRGWPQLIRVEMDGDWHWQRTDQWTGDDDGVYHDMLEETLKHCRGRVLDVGAGAGRLAARAREQRPDLEVVSLDIEPGCVQLMQSRGLANVVQADFLSYDANPGFDTLVFLNNGLGMAGTVARVPDLVAAIDRCLAPGGHVLFDGVQAMHGIRPFRARLEFESCISPEFGWLEIGLDVFNTVFRHCDYGGEVLHRSCGTFLGQLQRNADRLPLAAPPKRRSWWPW